MPPGSTAHVQNTINFSLSAIAKYKLKELQFLLQIPGIDHLVIVCRIWKRNHDGCLSHGGYFSHCGGTGSADHEIRRLIHGSHIHDKGLNLCWNTGFLITGFNFLFIR